MEVLRTPSQQPYPRTTRRSFPTINHLSLAPLSSRFPIGGDDDDDGAQRYDDYIVPRSSYIQSRTAPSTPGILSRSSSRHRKARNKHYIHEGHFLGTEPPQAGEIHKAKSSSALLVQQGAHPYARAPPGKRAGSTALRRPQASRAQTSDANDEWLHRAGLAIASETRDSKGQGWLVRKESSTSLVHQTDEYDEHPSHERSFTLMSGEHFADDEYSPITPRYSRMGSRSGSRAASAKSSRRGSRAGLAAPGGGGTPVPGAVRPEDGYFGEALLAEPDFVELGEEGELDEEEVARLAQERGFGLGGWVDRLIGRTLFRVEEDTEDTEDDSNEQEEIEDEIRRRRERQAPRRRGESDDDVGAAEGERPARVEPPPGDGEGGWQDAAWLLSVASKVLF